LLAFPAEGAEVPGDWGELGSPGDGEWGGAAADLEETATLGGAGAVAGVPAAAVIASAADRAAWMSGTAVDFDAGFKEFVWCMT
jgi:hypothetical protein